MKKIFKNKKLLVVALLLTFLTVIVICIIFLVKNRIQNSELDGNQDTETVSNPVSLSQATKVQYSGKFIKAVLSEGWRVKELEGGNYYPTSGEIKGFSGFEIYKGDLLVFKLNGVDGVGSNPLCGEVAKFNDTSEEYINSYKNYSEAPAQVIDLTGAQYSEFNLFDRKIRRIGERFYWDELSKTDSYFNPSCGFMGSFLTSNILNIIISRPGGSEDSINLFHLDLAENLTDEDLLTLDTTLDSLEWLKEPQSFSFTLNQGTVATPINGINEQFTLNTYINSDLSIESGVYFLRSDKFVITFAADPEPLPVGLGGPPLPESQVIENNLNKSIKRVNYDFGIQRQMENLSIEEFTKFYYYSDSFRQGIDCGDAGFVNNFCGGMTINIKKDNKKLDLNLDIRCAAKTAEDVKYCDELVKNLTVR